MLSSLLNRWRHWIIWLLWCVLQKKPKCLNSILEEKLKILIKEVKEIKTIIINQKKSIDFLYKNNKLLTDEILKINNSIDNKKLSTLNSCTHPMPQQFEFSTIRSNITNPSVFRPSTLHAGTSDPPVSLKPQLLNSIPTFFKLIIHHWIPLKAKNESSKTKMIVLIKRQNIYRKTSYNWRISVLLIPAVSIRISI